MTSFTPPRGAPKIAIMPPMWDNGWAERVAGWTAGAGGRSEITPSRSVENAMFQGDTVDDDRLDLEGAAGADERLETRVVAVHGGDPG